MSIHLNLFRILSRHFTFQANLKDAVERLEELVLHATESALRESTETGPSWDVLVNDGVFMCIFAVFQKNVTRKWKNHRRILASKFRAMSPVSMKIQCWKSKKNQIQPLHQGHDWAHSAWEAQRIEPETGRNKTKLIWGFNTSWLNEYISDFFRVYPHLMAKTHLSDKWINGFVGKVTPQDSMIQPLRRLAASKFRQN